MSHDRSQGSVLVEDLFPDSRLPPDLEQLARETGFSVAFLGEAYGRLHALGRGRPEVEAQLGSLPLMPGMGQLLRWAHGLAEVIVVSDSHTTAVELALKRHNLGECVSGIFANESGFSEDGALVFAELP